jgi:hypothetical protein
MITHVYVLRIHEQKIDHKNTGKMIIYLKYVLLHKFQVRNKKATMSKIM